MKVSHDGITLIVLFVALAVICALMMGPSVQTKSDLSTTYNPDANGVKAFYTLLGDRLGYSVNRLEAPYMDMPSEAKVLVVVAPLEQTPIVAKERDALENWVRAGGTAIFISDSLKNVPARFGSTRKLGKGFVYAMNSKRIITNKGMRDYKNAVNILDIIAEHAISSRALILFDEYHHGIGQSNAAAIHIQRQVKIGIVVLAVALLVLCYGKGRRFGAVRNLPASERLRPGFEFVESIGRLYERAGAADLAAEILVKSMRQGICLKLGLSPDAPKETIVRQLESDGLEQVARKVDELLIYEQAGQSLSKSELLHVAREIHSVEKELGFVGNVA